MIFTAIALLLISFFMVTFGERALATGATGTATIGDFLLPRGRRLRDFSWANLVEDFKLFRGGILDFHSLISGYARHHNPVQVVIRNPDGSLKAIRRTHNLRTNAGGDWQAAQMSGTGSTATASWLALSSDVTAPVTTDTTVAGEITTGGLARAQGTYAHTSISGTGASTNSGTYTLTKTFTATALQTAVQKAGMLTASSSGTLVFENTFSPATLNINDTIAVTWTITY